MQIQYNAFSISKTLVSVHLQQIQSFIYKDGVRSSNNTGVSPIIYLFIIRIVVHRVHKSTQHVACM